MFEGQPLRKLAHFVLKQKHLHGNDIWYQSCMKLFWY